VRAKLPGARASQVSAAGAGGGAVGGAPVSGLCAARARSRGPHRGAQAARTRSSWRARTWAQVVLTVRPHQQPAAREVPLVRQKIAFNPVSPHLCAAVSPTLEPGAGAAAPAAGAGAGGGARSGGKLGYIRVSTFNKQTSEGVRAALEQLHAGGAERCGAHIERPCLEPSLSSGTPEAAGSGQSSCYFFLINDCLPFHCPL